MSAMTTRAPSSSNASTMPRPMPAAPPVTTATLPRGRSGVASATPAHLVLVLPPLAAADLVGGRDQRAVLAEVVGRRADLLGDRAAATRGRSRNNGPRSRPASCGCRRPARRRSRCAGARPCSATCLRDAGSRCPTSRRRSRCCAGGGSPPSTSSTRRRRCSRRSTPTAASRGCPSSARPSSSWCDRRRGTGPTSTSCRRPSTTRLRSRRTSGRGTARTRR